MSSSSKNPKVLLDGLAEFMAQETEEMTDQQLLEEAGDTALALLHAENLKRLLEERAANARQERLAEARARYEAAIAGRESHTSAFRPPIVDLKRMIEAVFTDRGEIPLAVAYRNGEYQSDDDLRTLWDQLCELGAISQDQCRRA